MRLRPLHDWLLVCIDQPKEKLGSLFVPGGDAGRVRTATVIRSGPGKNGVPTELGEGDRVAFFRENQETLQGKQIGAILKDLGDRLALVRTNDILFTWKPGAEPEVE